LVTTAVERFERLDVLVGNAGIARTASVAEIDVDDWDAMIDVNVRGGLYGIAAALPVFHRQGRGQFVTIVSTSGLKIVPTQAVYAGTKNAVRTLLDSPKLTTAGQHASRTCPRAARRRSRTTRLEDHDRFGVTRG
jgi:NADP-dependent 3-hydroxy acid dehydrogenase YdfG